MDALILSILSALSLPIGVALLKARDQQQRDRERASFTITFPATLQLTEVHAWLQAASGALRARRGLFGLPTMAVELWVSERGMIHRLKLPGAQADYLLGQLRTLVPGIRVTPSEKEPSHQWTDAVELGHRQPLHSLNIASAENLSASLLASVGGLKRGEGLLMQWVLTSAVMQSPPPEHSSNGNYVTSLIEPDSDDIKDRRNKLKTPNFLGVLRLAARARTEPRAATLLLNVRSSLDSMTSSTNGFKRALSFSKAKLFKRIEQASGPLLYPGQLSVPELTALMGWPIGQPHVAGLPSGRARQLPASATVPRKGRVIGRSNFPGAERPVAVSPVDACKHLHVIGPTGVGKTTLLANLAAQDMTQGFGLVVLESKGDLFDAVLDRVPKERINDVIVWDLGDTAYPVGFNVLEQGSSRSAVDELNALLASIYPEGGIITPQVMYHGLHALAATPGGTFVDLPSILTPQADEVVWRENLVASIKSPEIRKFWQRYLNANPKEQDRESAPLHRRLWQFTARPEVRNSLGQSTSSFQMREVVASQKILLVNLAGVRIGTQTASIVGTLIVNALWNAVRTTKLKRPVFLYLDEFQNFTKLPTDPNDMLAQSRSFGLGMVLAHQHLAQLPREMEQAVMNNARTKVVFQTTNDDARAMARHFGRMVSEDDFVNLGPHEAIAKVAVGTTVSAPLTMTAEPPAEPTKLAEHIRKVSRQHYGRPVAQVDADIQARRTAGSGAGKTKPKVGGQKWG